MLVWTILTGMMGYQSKGHNDIVSQSATESFTLLGGAATSWDAINMINCGLNPFAADVALMQHSATLRMRH